MSLDPGVARDPYAPECDRCDALATTGLGDGTLLCEDCHADELDRGDSADE